MDYLKENRRIKNENIKDHPFFINTKNTLYFYAGGKLRIMGGRPELRSTGRQIHGVTDLGEGRDRPLNVLFIMRR